VDRTFRQPTWLRLICTVALLGFAAVLVAGGVQEGGALVALGLVGGALVLAVAVRGWLLRLVLSDEVVIVNWLQTHRVAWRDVEKFGCDGGVWIRRRGGGVVEVAAFSFVPGALPSAQRRNERAANELERARQKRRGHGAGRDRA
jgi:hypothetical protein